MDELNMMNIDDLVGEETRRKLSRKEEALLKQKVEADRLAAVEREKENSNFEE